MFALRATAWFVLNVVSWLIVFWAFEVSHNSAVFLWAFVFPFVWGILYAFVVPFPERKDKDNE